MKYRGLFRLLPGVIGWRVYGAPDGPFRFVANPIWESRRRAVCCSRRRLLESRAWRELRRLRPPMPAARVEAISRAFEELAAFRAARASFASGSPTA